MSRVFDPVLVIPVLLGVVVWVAFVNGERLRFLALLMAIDVVLPGFVLFWFVQKKRVLSGWDVTSRRERVPLFNFVVLAHMVGVMAAWFVGKHPLAEYLTSFWMMTVVYALITMVWKISIHAGVMSAVVTFGVMQLGVRYAWLYGLVLLVVWARVEGQYHRLSQAVAGAVLPLVLIPVVWEIMGL